MPVLYSSRLTLLGVRLTSDGIHPGPTKLVAIREFSKPQSTQIWKPSVFMSWRFLGYVIYLSNRRQRVRVGDNYSNYAIYLGGVSRGNVLGPLLFVTYITKLVQCSPAEVSNNECADYIMLECTYLSQSTVCRSLFTAVTALGTWLENRGLLANDQMTRVMVYQPHGASASLPPVLCGDELLPTVHSVRYLGVTIDDGLTWNGHVDKVTKEVRKATGALWQSR